MKHWLVGVIAVCAALLSSGCASSGGGAQSRVALAIPDTTSSVQSADFKIAPLDVLEITVFGVERLSGELQVDPEGKVNVPLIGRIAAGGLTSFEFARDVQSRYATAYLQDPQVTVRIKSTFGQKVTVEGQVGKPGIYEIRGATTLLQAIALAEGLREGADQRRVVVFRTIEGKRKAAAFDLSSIRAGRAEDPTVFGNDIIVIDGSQTATTWRELIRTIPALGVFVAIF